MKLTEYLFLTSTIRSFYHRIFSVFFSDTVAPTAQPSSFPSGFTSMIPYSWSKVPYPADPLVTDAILSAVWFSSSTVVAVGRTGDQGLVLVSTTSGSSWTSLQVSTTDSIVHYSLMYLSVDRRLQYITSMYDSDYTFAEL